MKLFKSAALFLAITLSVSSEAQVIVGSAQYNTQKQNGTLDQSNVLSVPTPVTAGTVNNKPTNVGSPKSGCQCYIQPDASYTVANFGGATDDGSQGPIAIPFNFCLYGVNYTQFYLNINGNVTFDQAYGTFSSVPFPSNQYVMVAPFWGDVDLGGTGTIYYKITPTAVYVNWEQVGYYSSQVDKLNTFQLILTDGTDPIIPSGNNIAFCYGDMQWTTGAASGGVGGFGGTPATVGVNKGDGIDYLQIGRFDQPGSVYDGPVGNPDGVDWLDNQSLYFNVCAAVNIPPIFGDFGIGGAAGVGGGNNCVGGDTVRICGIGDGDTLILNPSFLAPEAGQTVTVTANFNGMTGGSIISSSPGNPGSAGIMIVGDATNAGYHVIDIIGTDDGTPIQTTTVSLTIFIDTLTAAFNPEILGDTIACDDVTLSLDSAFTYDTYEWNLQPSDSTLFVDSSGAYWVTVSKSGCIKSDLVNVTITGAPEPMVSGSTFTCANDSALITLDLINSTNLPYDSLDWGSGLDTVTSTYWMPGNHTLTVIDTNGCIGSVNYTINSSAPLNIFSNTISLCNTFSTSFPPGANSGENGGSWSVISSPPGSTVDFQLPTSFNPTVTVDQYGVYQVMYTDPCGDSDTANFVFNVTPTATLTDTFFCAESFPAYTLDPDSINGSSLFNYVWSTGDTTETISVTDTGTYSVTISNACGTATATSEVTAISITFPLDTSVCGLSYQFPWNAVDAPNGGVWDYVANAGDSLWFSPDSAAMNPLITVNNFTTYTLNFTDSLCGIQKTINIEFRIWAYADIQDDTACISNQVNLNAFGIQNQTYLWNTGSTASDIDVTTTGDYYVTVTNSCNSYTDTAHIEFILCSCSIPNVITPNGDGMNDELDIDCVEFIDQGVLQVYNRWGTLVYEKDTYDNSWDGKSSKGTVLEDGTYFYIFTVMDTGDTYKGTVNVFND